MYSIPHGFYDQTHPTASPHPVGTRGGCEEGWGPCACPRRYTSRLDIARTDRTCTRTGTRPPHPLNTAPCPYRMGRLLTRFYIEPARFNTSSAKVRAAKPVAPFSA